MLPFYFDFNLFMPELVQLLKTIFVLIFFIWVRAAFPRYRYDQIDEFRLEKIFTIIFILSLFYVQSILYIFNKFQ